MKPIETTTERVSVTVFFYSYLERCFWHISNFLMRCSCRLSLILSRSTFLHEKLGRSKNIFIVGTIFHSWLSRYGWFKLGFSNMAADLDVTRLIEICLNMRSAFDIDSYLYSRIGNLPFSTHTYEYIPIPYKLHQHVCFNCLHCKLY